jgi:hypothetical protein
VQRARRTGLQDGPTQPCLGAQLDAAVDDPRAHGARVVFAAGEADTAQVRRGGRQHGDLLGSQLARAGDSGIRVEGGADQRERTRVMGGVLIDAETHRAGW